MRKKTIYLVEDEPDISEMIQYLLSSTGGGEVTPCLTAEMFWKQMKVKLPDLIILDIMLPDGNGADIGEQLASANATDQIPILFMSANHSFKLPPQLSKNQFISKPFDINVFSNKVESLLVG